jgi:hypothetical protein
VQSQYRKSLVEPQRCNRCSRWLLKFPKRLSIDNCPLVRLEVRSPPLTPAEISAPLKLKKEGTTMCIHFSARIIFGGIILGITGADDRATNEKVSQ